MAPHTPLLADMAAHSSLLRSDGRPAGDYDVTFHKVESPLSPSASVLHLGHSLRRRPLRTCLIVLSLGLILFVGVARYVPEEKASGIFKAPFGLSNTTYGWWGDTEEDELEPWEMEDVPIVHPTASLSQPPHPDLGLDLEGADSSDPNNVLLPIEPPRPPRLLQPITDRLPYSLVSTFYSQGVLDTSVPIPYPSPMDVVYLWVNASGEPFQEAMAQRAEAEGVGSRGRGKRYRDNGELRGALRSAVKSLGDRLGTIHVLSGDYPTLETPDEPEEYREEKKRDAHNHQLVGQIPRWLNWESAKQGLHKVAWHFHSSFWRMPIDLDEGEAPPETFKMAEATWREHSIPNFNSFAIESRVGWVNGLSETFLLANDDMFFLNSLNHADFQHPLYGTVLRMDCGPSLRVKPFVTPDLKSTPGEWGGLQHAAMLIKNRFTDQRRMYMAHMPKALSLSLTHEASIMFGDALTEAATRGFRQSRRGVADVEMSWLVSHLRIERWREALLWTWAVAKLGGQDGAWGEDAKVEIAELLGTSDTELREVVVQKGPRETMRDMDQVTEEAGWESTEFTRYYYSSMDGTVPMNLPERPDRIRTQTQCTFSFVKCLPADFFESDDPLDAAEMFRHLTFVEPQCGDCLIMSLVTASGVRGLEAFFPDIDMVYRPPSSDPEPWQRSEPMLPLTPTWQQANFDISNIVKVGQDEWQGVRPRGDGGVNMRQWCMKLLTRYAYVFAWTQTQFFQIHSTIQLRTAVKKLDDTPRLAMTCINDDQPDAGSVGAVDVFGQWMKSRWGDMSPGWEKHGEPWAGDPRD